MRHGSRVLVERELIAVCLLIGLGLGLLLVSKIQAMVAPQLRLFAVEQVQAMTQRSLQTALTETAKNTLGDALTFEKDKDGRIVAVKTDVAALSALQHTMLMTVYETVEQFEVSTLRIPVGAISWLTVPVKEVRIVQATAIFRNQLSDMGINQTRHSTILDVTAQVDIHMPTFSASTTVELEIVVFETLIVGFVPQYYGESS
jgi:Sporulation protein YunB (Spo_YunB).